MKKEKKVKDLDVMTMPKARNPIRENQLAAEADRRWYDPYGGPFRLMRHFPAYMENMFKDFGFNDRLSAPDFFTMDQPWFRETDFPGDFAPPVEVFEADGRFVVRAELPGMKKEDINVEIHDDHMIIEGERKQEFEENREGFYKSEFSFGTFYRRIPLPETADPKDAKAIFRNGVLEVALAAPAIEFTGKRLEIKDETPKVKAATG